MSDNAPLALSVERVRHEMLRGILIPRELVNEALQTTARKLKAKETKFFSHKGRIQETVEVDDHGTQLAAADQIFSLAGLYSRERQERASTPGVALEIDPSTGVVRIVVGSPQAMAELPPATTELPPVELSPAESNVVIMRRDVAAPQGSRVARQKGVPDAVWNIVSDEIVE